MIKEKDLRNIRLNNDSSKNTNVKSEINKARTNKRCHVSKDETN